MAKHPGPSNHRWITDGLEERCVNKSTIIPSGWSFGRASKVRSKISNGLTDKVQSEEQKKKNSESHKGLPGPMAGKHHRQESRDKISRNKTGKPTAQKGVPKTQEHKDAMSLGKLSKNGTGKPAYWRDSREYASLVLVVKTRDDYTCQDCGITEKQWYKTQKLLGIKQIKGLHCHHRKDAEKFPEYRFDPSTCITLCGICHTKEHNYFSKSFPTKTSSIKLPLRKSTYGSTTDYQV